jgi:hypothetical protein
VDVDEITCPNITHHAFFCKLTLCSRHHFAHVHVGRSFCTQATPCHLYSNLLCSTLQWNIMCKDIFVHQDHCYNIIASSLPFCNLHLDMSCVLRSRWLKDCEYVGIKTWNSFERLIS